MTTLPTWEQMRTAARNLLSDARDELKSDWQPGTGPNRDAAASRLLAIEYIGLAKAALDDAARYADR